MSTIWDITCSCGADCKAATVADIPGVAWSCPVCQNASIHLFDKPVDPLIEQQAQEFLDILNESR